ncbi:MAG: hypothetical protein HW406_1511 [Candidatus Brocadiaceae bacterium]|nr:hypothetical protein [Candidatus Brocadiaceae bacterium]MBM2834350.1 hypothetical protein [Candidatus Brocadiaceae bacterium]
MNQCKVILVFLLSICIVYFFDVLSGLSVSAAQSDVIRFLYPVITCTFVIAIQRFVNYKSLVSYALIFSISITSFLGITKTLTGAYAGSTNALFFGLSFYSASLAYKSFNNRLCWQDVFIVANPLLLFTGPIATTFQNITTTRIYRRFTIYFPFLVTGVFFYKIIACPLAMFLPLIALTNSIGAVTFACIFELFVYFNFAGLSLIMYALFGFFGIRIPLNFRQPFSSRNLIEFWRGWHVSLSSVFKQMFYTPVSKRFNGHLAIFAVFISSVVWHGVTANFFIWGIFHAVCFILTKALLKRGGIHLATILMLFAIVIDRMVFADI